MAAGWRSAARLLPWSLYDQARSQASRSRSTSIPPSPPVDMILSVQNDQAAASPNDPTGRPSMVAPCAWAQSSMTLMPWPSASAMISFMAHGQPARWTAMMARVRGVITAAIAAAVMFWLSASTSAKTGRAPQVTTAPADAKKLRGVTMTSSPGPMPRARKASSSASVPLASAMAWGIRDRPAKAVSKAVQLSPWTSALVRPDRSTAMAAATSSSAWCGQRETTGASGGAASSWWTQARVSWPTGFIAVPPRRCCPDPGCAAPAPAAAPVRAHRPMPAFRYGHRRH